ncbi:hypothetical protein IWX65_003553 [Arthrobacter sp. CAN_A214]|uniref:hypothetical protein n=1 Tax=Arthrobacter sp. CAN_A214 TaxID=2787720 RepID=UPI0018C9ABB7
MSHEALQPDEQLRAALSQVIAVINPTLADRLEHDVDSYLDLIDATQQGSQEIAQLLQAAVTSARLAGASWDRIGQRMGISRQAAQQRFGRTPADNEIINLEATRRLTPVTAFDEMEALSEAGREGWHSVGFGMYFHDLARSDEQWEHLRVGAFSAKHKDLLQAGWQKIGSMWFPWAYYKRPTGAPVRTT